MSFTEQELEDKLRYLIQTKVIPECKQIQMLSSKDVTDIICCDNEKPALFFIEVKHYTIANGRIGFGSRGKITFQPEILKTKPLYFEKNLRWIFCDENFKDYYILTSEQCRHYVMGDVISYDKQNNFKLDIFKNEKKYSEEELCVYLIKWFNKE